MQVVYVSGPFTGEVATNRAAAIAMGEKLRCLGYCALVPHIAVVPFEEPDAPRSYAQAMRECVELMKRCDAVLMTERWQQSRGARIEHFLALRAGITVAYTIAELLFKTEFKFVSFGRGNHG